MVTRFSFSNVNVISFAAGRFIMFISDAIASLINAIYNLNVLRRGPFFLLVI